MEDFGSDIKMHFLNISLAMRSCPQGMSFHCTLQISYLIQTVLKFDVIYPEYRKLFNVKSRHGMPFPSSVPEARPTIHQHPPL